MVGKGMKVSGDDEAAVGGGSFGGVPVPVPVPV